MKQSENEKELRRLLGEVRLRAAALPEGKARAVNNFCDKISVLYRRHSVVAPGFDEGETAEQIEKRYIAKRAIFDAMTQGRHISLKDSREFRVSEMHTQMHCIARDLETNPDWVLRSKWVKCGTAGARCKEYWLERTEALTN